MLPRAVLSTREFKAREEGFLLVCKLIKLSNLEGILFGLDVSRFLKHIDLLEQATCSSVKVLSLLD